MRPVVFLFCLVGVFFVVRGYMVSNQSLARAACARLPAETSVTRVLPMGRSHPPSPVLAASVYNHGLPGAGTAISVVPRGVGTHAAPAAFGAQHYTPPPFLSPPVLPPPYTAAGPAPPAVAPPVFAPPRHVLQGLLNDQTIHNDLYYHAGSPLRLSDVRAA